MSSVRSAGKINSGFPPIYVDDYCCFDRKLRLFFVL
jgi:hypothetical protein